MTTSAVRPGTSPLSDPKSKRSPSSHASLSTVGYEGHYVAGTTLAERYRIVALLGKGGMGEVYRAEDLRLGQTVALKFLPDSMLEDEAARTRFHQEVRLSREIAHPNVCRVFDIGEADGRLFLTMEYIDGEDLASLLRRIGQLPQSKGLDIARQLCAGLAAAHDHGVLHRDLKPGNIMLDGRGRVRITDFGLAALGGSLGAEELRAGTPSYMAPEQLAGTEVSVRSDIYSLGLVLYEVFTGKRAFEAATLPELVRLREHSSPTSISSLVRDIDPLVERVIVRCLEKDPAKRPATALQVSAALPGGDPLAAALAAGETPSPEMVARAGEKEGLRPGIAWALLLVVIVGLAAVALLANKATVVGAVPLPISTEVLSAKARDFARQIGYVAPPADTSYGMGNWLGYLDYVETHDESVDRWKNLSAGTPPVLVLWYRESPRLLDVREFSWSPLAVPNDPPNTISGMCQIFFDTLGHLVEFECVPPQFESSTSRASPPDWAPLFAAAGLDAGLFHPVPPEWNELVEADVRAAWAGNGPGHPEIPLRVEAGAFRGIPVYFEMVWPWTKPDRMRPQKSSMSNNVSNSVFLVMFAAALFAGIRLARRNLRAGRGDRAGAFRIALVVFLMTWVAICLFAHHVPSFHEVMIFCIITGWALLFGSFVWLLYIALEPHVRRRWPNSLISWTRLLSGQLRDPIVGRDLLLGMAAGVVWAVCDRAAFLAPGWMGKAPAAPLTTLDMIQLGGGIRTVLADLLLNVTIFVFFALTFFFGFFLLRMLTRREWVAGALMAAVISLAPAFGAHPVINTVESLLVSGMAMLVLIRFGLLALIVTFTLQNALGAFPLTAHLSAWYAEPTLFVFSLLLAIALAAFYSSTAGKSVFGSVSLEE
ncbi:MAG TPA: protein kinase [Candidatus Cybelea sp.]|nr:protein kinase [Candidatus Cybelea sp.]